MNSGTADRDTSRHAARTSRGTSRDDAGAGEGPAALGTQIGPRRAQIGPAPPPSGAPAPRPSTTGPPDRRPPPRHLPRRDASGRRCDGPPPGPAQESREALGPAAPFIGVARLSRRQPPEATRRWEGTGEGPAAGG
jgi:hypothetical protein